MKCLFFFPLLIYFTHSSQKLLFSWFEPTTAPEPEYFMTLDRNSAVLVENKSLRLSHTHWLPSEMLTLKASVHLSDNVQLCQQHPACTEKSCAASMTWQPIFHCKKKRKRVWCVHLGRWLQPITHLMPMQSNSLNFPPPQAVLFSLMELADVSQLDTDNYSFFYLKWQISSEMAAVYVLVCNRTTVSLIKHSKKSHLSHLSIIRSRLVLENLLFWKHSIPTCLPLMSEWPSSLPFILLVIFHLQFSYSWNQNVFLVGAVVSSQHGHACSKALRCHSSIYCRLIYGGPHLGELIIKVQTKHSFWHANACFFTDLTALLF